MNRIRRALVAALAIGLVRPLAALAAWNKEAFGAKTAADALKNLGVPNAAPSGDLHIEAPQIAENGAVVPIEISSNIPGTTALIVVIEKNPFPLAATFDVANGAEPYTSVRIKLGQTSYVRAVVKADGRFYTAAKEVKVTVGGCG